MELDKIERIFLMIGLASVSVYLGEWVYRKMLESSPPPIQWTPVSAINDASNQISRAIQTAERQTMSA